MSKKVEVGVNEVQSSEVKKIELDEATYNDMLEKCARLTKAEDKLAKQKEYRKNRYNRIKNILNQAKAAGIK